MVFGSATLVLNNATNVPTDVVNRARKTLEFIEVYVLLTTILIAFLVVFGSWRRHSHSSKLKYLIFIAYVLSTYLISYTMGQMGSAIFRDELFAVWATFLLIFLGSADCISAYSLEDNENRKRYNLELLIQYFWLGWLIGMYSLGTKFSVPLCILYVLSLFRTAAKSKALELASKSYGLVRSAKLIADYMNHEHELSSTLDAENMTGYKYLVKYDEKVEVMKPLYQKELLNPNEAVTIEEIWQCTGRLLSSNVDPKGRLKDICLSYALFRLLCRRFADYSCSESSHEKTWDFVQNGLLSTSDDNYERAFRVIEVELAFLYDFFYTKYPVFFVNGLPILRTFEFIVVIVVCCVVVAVLAHYNASNVDLNLMTPNGHDVDVLLTGIVIVAILCMDVVQIFFINISNWAKVQWICYYVKNLSWHNNIFIEKFLQLVCHMKWLKPWERKLSQYSLLQSFNHNPNKLFYNSWTSPYIDMERKGQKQSAPITLPEQVRKAIIESLMKNGRQLTNGIASLQRNGVIDLSWACRLETQTHVIMVWHIATSVCELNLSLQVIPTKEQAKTRRGSHEFIVATKLSKYCAYLVAFAPRFLPDHAYTTEFIFDQVVGEARNDLSKCNSERSVCEMILRTFGNEDPAENTIFKRGAVLANHLLTRIENNGQRWKILAEFWADMMLFITPSNDTTAHAEHLAKGGEFVTHLWALLSHAGILKRDSAREDV
ncbi:hypothetical protein FCV25MIE_30516 [Fagus crenata]